MRNGSGGPCVPAVGRGRPVPCSVLTTKALVTGVGTEDMTDAAQGAVLRHLGGHLARPCLSVGLDFGSTWSSILLKYTRQPLAFGIRVIPEIGEEQEEDSTIHPDQVDDDRVLVVTAGHEVILGDVQ